MVKFQKTVSLFALDHNFVSPPLMNICKRKKELRRFILNKLKIVCRIQSNSTQLWGFIRISPKIYGSFRETSNSIVA